jgi:hypothetical protein
MIYQGIRLPNLNSDRINTKLPERRTWQQRLLTSSRMSVRLTASLSAPSISTTVHRTDFCRISNFKFVPNRFDKFRFLLKFNTNYVTLYTTSNQINPITGLDRPWGFQEVEAPRFQDNRHIKVVRLSALRTGRLYPPRKYSWYSFMLDTTTCAFIC